MEEATEESVKAVNADSKINFIGGCGDERAIEEEGIFLWCCNGQSLAGSKKIIIIPIYKPDQVLLSAILFVSGMDSQIGNLI